jgi:O-acetyl-ADP-ribose deacetylase (regulator of RNase III)
MLTYHRTSLLESQAQTIVNTVNTVGVMGKGLAAALKARDPEMFKSYKRICDQGLLDIGKLWLWRPRTQWVLNFPTKTQWRRPSKIEYIALGLEKFVAQYEAKGIREIAFPRLGCGNGGLEWDDVRPLMHSFLADLPIRIYIHDFDVELDFPEHKEYSPQYAHNSFHDFFCDIGHTIDLNDGKFKLLDNVGEFNAKTIERDDETILSLSGNGWSTEIDEFDLSELWMLLLKGPVDSSRLVGMARDAVSPLFSVLSTIDYVRPVEISRNSEISRIALEIRRNKFLSGTVAA